MPIVVSDYKAPTWCPGGHLQTVLPAKLMPRPKVSYRREKVEMLDGDFVLWDWVEPEPLDPKTPVLVHFHGLEGSSRSHYAEALMASCVERGWRGVVAHFRSCGGEMNRLPRAYFAGDSADCEWVLKMVHNRYPQADLRAVGVSLGANQLSKFLGDRGEDASFLKAAAAIGAPLDLVAGSERISKGVNTLYAEMFLSTLKPKLEQKAKMFPGVIDMDAVRACKTMFDFDNVYTAPIHGFASAMDYWQKCSAKPVLKNVRVPLLLLNAQNDPFFPAWGLPTESEISSSVVADFPKEGGHIGFPQGRAPGNILYLPQRVMRFFDTGS